MSSATVGAAYEMLTNLEKGIVPANAVWPVWPWIVGGAALILVGGVTIALDVTLRRQKPSPTSTLPADALLNPSSLPKD